VYNVFTLERCKHLHTKCTLYLTTILYFNYIAMKKTQKILDALKYIDNLDLSPDEILRLSSEVDSLTMI